MPLSNFVPALICFASSSLDAMIGFSRSQYNFTEQDMPFQDVCITLLNDVIIEVNLPLRLQTEEFTAMSSDFLSINRSVNVNGSMCFNVEIIRDVLVENLETFLISIKSLDTRLLISGSNQATINIIDSNCKYYKAVIILPLVI